MHARWYNVAVVGFWLTTMGWLVTTKILPAMLLGEPPSYQTILDARRGEPPVGWRLFWNDRPIGWALSLTESHPSGVTEIESRVHFDDLPIEEMTPSWAREMFRSIDRPKTSMNADSRLTFDPFGQLSSVRSVVRVGHAIDAVVLEGSVDGAVLKAQVRAGSLTHNTEIPISDQTLLSDALSPQTRIQRLRLGQTWSIVTYNPLRSPTNPVEILQAAVETTEPILVEGQPEEVFVVVYRADAGRRLGGMTSWQQRLFVRQDGTVVRQEVRLLGSTMTFVRLPERQAASLAEKVLAERSPQPTAPAEFE